MIRPWLKQQESAIQWTVGVGFPCVVYDFWYSLFFFAWIVKYHQNSMSISNSVCCWRNRPQRLLKCWRKHTENMHWRNNFFMISTSVFVMVSQLELVKIAFELNSLPLLPQMRVLSMIHYEFFLEYRNSQKGIIHWDLKTVAGSSLMKTTEKAGNSSFCCISALSHRSLMVKQTIVSQKQLYFFILPILHHRIFTYLHGWKWHWRDIVLMISRRWWEML